MKTEQEREQLIKNINVLLNQAYDSTLDEIYALLLKIEDEEDKNDLRAYHAAKNDRENNSLIAWEEIQEEIASKPPTTERSTVSVGALKPRVYPTKC